MERKSKTQQHFTAKSAKHKRVLEDSDDSSSDDNRPVHHHATGLKFEHFGDDSDGDDIVFGASKQEMFSKFESKLLKSKAFNHTNDLTLSYR